MKDALPNLVDAARKPHSRLFRAAATAAAASAVAGILLLALSGWFITGAALAGIAGVLAAQGFNYLLPSAAIRLFAIIRTASRYGERLWGHKAALHTLAALRVTLFTRLIAADVAASARASGDLTARLMEDVAALEDRLVRSPSTIGTVVGMAAALACVASAGPVALSGVAIVMGGAFWLARARARAKLPAAASAVSEAVAALKNDLISQASAAADVAAYGLATPVAAHLMRRAADLDHARARLNRVETGLDVLATVAGGLSVALVLIVSAASLPFTILAALAAAGSAELLAALIRSQSADARLGPSIQRLDAMAQAVAPSSDTQPLTGAPAIAFMLNRERVFLSPGDRIAITGASGAGKSRLVETIAGWRNDMVLPMWLDDAPVRPGHASQRRPSFALAPQDAEMVAGTIADNLRLARPGLDDAALWEALETACLADDVRAMPHGLDHWVGDGGARLSGGQRKRLSVARALLAARPWLVLDEPSEGLDHDTEACLRERLGQWLATHGAGLILISHRPAMLTLADRQVRLGERPD